MEDSDSEINQVERVKFSKIHLLLLASSTLGLLYLLLSHNAASGGPVLILVFLFFLFVFVFSLANIASNLVVKLVGLKKPSVLRELYTGVSIAAGFVFLVGLMTLNQLQLADVVLVIAFELLLNFYLFRRF